MFQNWWLFTRIHINLMGQFQCISNPSKVQRPLYIWSGHYARDAWGLRPFDHQKYTVVLRPFSVMLRPLLLTFFTFCYFLLLFLLLVIFWNYFLLLKVQCLLLFVTFFTACNCHKLLFLLLKTARGIIYLYFFIV
jgi:hypothetical protein